MDKYDPTRDGDTHPDIAEAEAEVIEIHRVIAGWLNGKLARTPEHFAEFADALVDEFTIMHPDGVFTRLADLLPRFESRHGSAPDLTIDIRDFRVVISSHDRSDSSVATDGVTVVTYEAWQGSTGRFNTAVLIADPDGPRGVYRWLHLQETWIAQPPVVDAP
jgi:hypothetical protein